MTQVRTVLPQLLHAVKSLCTGETLVGQGVVDVPPVSVQVEVVGKPPAADTTGEGALSGVGAHVAIQHGLRHVVLAAHLTQEILLCRGHRLT